MRSAGGARREGEEGARAESPFRANDTRSTLFLPSPLHRRPRLSSRFPGVSSYRRRAIESLPSSGEKLFSVYVSLLRARKRAPAVNPGRNRRGGGGELGTARGRQVRYITREKKKESGQNLEGTLSLRVTQILLCEPQSSRAGDKNRVASINAGI